MMKWLLGVVALVGVGGLLFWGFTMGRAELTSEAERDAPIKTPTHVLRTPEGEVVITLIPGVQRRFRITTARLEPVSFQPQAVAYGELQADPLRRFTLRTPVSGILSEEASVNWPEIGTKVEAGTVIGDVQPLLSPVERVDLATRLASAQGQVEEHRARLVAARASFEHKKALSDEDGGVSDRAVEEAETLVHTEEARLKSAVRSIRLIEAVLSPTSQPADAIALELTQGGEVVEVAAKPGEVVQQGQPVVTVARFDQLIARVELPAGVTLDQPPAGARIIVLGHENHPMRGTLSMQAAANPNTRGQAFLFTVHPDGLPLRPGAAVTAYLESGNEAQRGVVVPCSAVVRAEDRTWVFVQVGEEQFAQRAVDLSHRTKTGWFVMSGFSTGDRIVVAGAQVLLSEAMKSEIRIGEEQR